MKQKEKERSEDSLPSSPLLFPHTHARTNTPSTHMHKQGRRLPQFRFLSPSAPKRFPPYPPTGNAEKEKPPEVEVTSSKYGGGREGEEAGGWFLPLSPLGRAVRNLLSRADAALSERSAQTSQRRAHGYVGFGRAAGMILARPALVHGRIRIVVPTLATSCRRGRHRHDSGSSRRRRLRRFPLDRYPRHATTTTGLGEDVAAAAALPP